MSAPIRAGASLPTPAFSEIRRVMELDHQKWETQIGDESTLADFPLIIDASTWRALAEDAEALARETVAMETELLTRPDLHERLALAKPLSALLGPGSLPPTPAAARVMRFDFHWTTEGWRVSEVNSDVPGGYAEAETFTSLVAAHFPGTKPAGEPARMLTEAIAEAAGSGAVALLAAPGHMEDHQVIAHLALRLRRLGIDAHPCSLHQIRYSDGSAALDAGAFSGPVSVVVRFYQAEWLAELPARAGWTPMFAGGRTPVVNPAVAALSESKRLPLVWDALRAPSSTWRRLLPESRDPRDAPWREGDDWALKLAYCNTGDSVAVRPAMKKAAWSRAAWRARLWPGRWVAQRRFRPVPVESPRGVVYPCIGVYTVNGRAAGIYGRLSRGLVISGAAMDAAVLVTEGGSL
ncbi:MAG: glutathionylspermidine synthase family protein [Polyangiaceae bacterium]